MDMYNYTCIFSVYTYNYNNIRIEIGVIIQ